MIISNHSSSISLIAAFLLLLLPATTQAAGFLEKSFSCKVETNVEVTVVDPEQEGVEFLIDDCRCSISASSLAEVMEFACQDLVAGAARQGLTRAQVQPVLGYPKITLEGVWERYKLSLGGQASATKTVYCITQDQYVQYMAACLQSGLEGTP